MADIFLSYARADQDKVRSIVALLETEGWTVWWDTSLRAGDEWDDVIDREIRSARCILVVWSPTSVGRYWVRVEANFGLGRGILVPVLIDGAELPLAFSLIQAIDLSGWTGTGPSSSTQRMVADVRQKIDAHAVTPSQD